MTPSSFYHVISIVCLAVCLLNSCVSPSSNTGSQIKEVDSTTVFLAADLKHPLVVDSQLCDSIIAVYPALDAYSGNVRLFYSARDWSPAWYGSDVWREHAAFLMQWIGSTPLEGIRDSFPALYDLQEVMNRYSGSGAFEPRLDVLLTYAFFWYAEMAWQGLPVRTSRAMDWFLPRLHKDSRAWLDSALRQQPDAGLLSKAVFMQYYSLRSRIQEYDSIRKQGGWPSVEPAKRPLSYGDTGPDVLALQKSLKARGDLKGLSDSAFFDSVLTKAVFRFQERHGLKADGICGKSFFQALNVSIDDRITQMLINLERCRWMPHALPDRFLLVNIPEFRLHLIDERIEKKSIPVVVGKDIHQTVSFSGDMKTVVFHPYWVIPSGILYDEIIPAVIRSATYLSRHDMEVVGASGRLIPSASIDWNRFRKSGFPYTVRQRPGPNNPLGEVKFLFPNNHSIYLHDSPGKSLFSREKRTFSHGCIRVGDARALAEFVMSSEGWSNQAVDSAFISRRERWVTLSRSLPVYIVYFTAWVGQDGVLHFRDDVYKRDEKLKAELLR